MEPARPETRRRTPPIALTPNLGSLRSDRAGKLESENGAAAVDRLRPQASAMVLGERAADGKPDAQAVRPGGVERLEDPLAQLG